MQLSRLSLPVVLALLVPSLALAAPATSVSELIDRQLNDDSTHQFSFILNVSDTGTSDKATITVRGEARGVGINVIAHGSVLIDATHHETGTTDHMRFRLAVIDQVLYIKASTSADSDAQALTELSGGLGVDPWLAIPLNAAESEALVSEYNGLLPSDFTPLLSDSSALKGSILDAVLALSSTPGANGSTIYTITLHPRPVLSLLQALDRELGGAISGGEDLTHDINLRRADGWIRDAVSFLMHVTVGASGDLDLSDLTFKLAYDGLSFDLSGSTVPAPAPLMLLKPLLTVPFDQANLSSEQDFGNNWSTPPLLDGSCSVADQRRGVCTIPHVSRRELWQGLAQ